jgi:hypothetical protein
MKTQSANGKLVLADTHIVFSYAQKTAIISFAEQSMRFIKKQHPDIRRVSSVTVAHWNEFMESKASVCSTATLSQYATKIRKLSRCVNHCYNISTDWATGLHVPKSNKTPDGKPLRVQQMERGDFDAIIGYIYASGLKTRAVYAWELTARFGLRVSGTENILARNVHLGNPGRWGFGQLDIIEKGGRQRYIDVMRADDRAFLERLIAGKRPDDHLVGITRGAINRELNRVMVKLDLKHKYPVTGEHSIRKLYAQTCWDFCLAKGMSPKKTFEHVNVQLGHSKTRKELLRLYVRDMT